MSKRHRFGFSSLAVAGSLVALLLGSTAQATTIYTLTEANFAGTGPYGTASVTLTDSNTAHITFTSASGFFFTDGGSVAVNSNGNAVMSNFAGNALAGGPCPTGGAACYSDGGSGNEDGFGSFSDRVNTTDSFSNRSSTISFDLDLTSGTWASDADVLAANSLGNFAAAHIGVCNNDSCTAFSLTGFATDGPTTPVPEPASLLILGGSLLGMGLLARRRRNAG